MNDDRRIDLSPLDGEADPARLERTARAVAARVAPSLRGRRERAGIVWLQLASWRRPVLAAAALLAAVSIVALATPGPRPARVGATVPATLAEAAGLPVALAAWVENGTDLSDEALIHVQEMP